MTAPNNPSRFKNRTRMAWLSFALLALFILTMCIRLALGDDPNSWVGLGLGVLAMLTSIVLGWQGSVVYEKKVEAETGTGAG